MRLFAILRRCHMERLLEHTSKITDIFKSALHGNISDTYLPIELRFAYAHFFGYPIRIE